MDNPCFDDDWRKTVYTIERLGEPAAAAGQTQEFRKSKLATLATAILLATIIVLITTAALVYTLGSVHENYSSGPVTASPWQSEMIVSGEFRIINEPFRSSLYNLSSTDFINLARRIAKELKGVYAGSILSRQVQGVVVTSLGPGLTVRCSITLQAVDSLTLGKVGVEFLEGLNRSHGHLWLGPFAIDVLSIGFQARTEQVSWSEWSDWSDCQLSMGGQLVRKRRRVCLSLEGLKLSRSEACQAVSGPQADDTQLRPCPVTTPSMLAQLTTESTTTSRLDYTNPRPENTTFRHDYTTYRSEDTTSMVNNTTSMVNNMTSRTDYTTSRSDDTTSRLNNTTSRTKYSTYRLEDTTFRPITTTMATQSSTQSTSTLQYTTIKQVAHKERCWWCLPKEVCVAMEGETVPVCRSALDLADPTGCGGLCQINTQVCHRLGQRAYRCIDDSKCLDNEWRCGNTLCIPFIKRCDGHFNCYDHTDEHNCDCDLKTHFQCGQNLSCLPQSKRCDGIVDCWDAADESNCTIACLDETQFTCNDSQCIPSKNFCDGFFDCNDHSDEPFGCGGVCKSHEWRCSNGRCIVKKDVCNGHDDCGDSSDELKCGKRRGRI